MGGNACKHLGVTRKSIFEYSQIKYEVGKILRDENVKHFFPYELTDKTDFGDLDVLITDTSLKGTVRNFICKHFNPSVLEEEIAYPNVPNKNIIANGNVYSFPYKNFQIDFIIIPEKHEAVYRNFYCYGDLGMCIGRLSRIYDLKYGVDGLSIPIRNQKDNHVIGVISVSTDVAKIYKFLGLDYEELMENGLCDQMDIISFILKSDIISQDFLDADSENTKSRKRDRQRTGFKIIHEWFTENRNALPDKPKRVIPDKYEDKLKYLDEYFPESNLVGRYNEIMSDISRANEAHEKFNMGIIIEMHGKEPNTFASINRWNAKFKTKSEKVAYILAHSKEELIDEVKQEIELDKLYYYDETIKNVFDAK